MSRRNNVFLGLTKFLSNGIINNNWGRNGFDGDITAIGRMPRTLCRLVNHSKQNIIADNYDYALAA